MQNGENLRGALSERYFSEAALSWSRYSIMTTGPVVRILFLLLQEVQLNSDNPIHNTTVYSYQLLILMFNLVRMMLVRLRGLAVPPCGTGRPVLRGPLCTTSLALMCGPLCTSSPGLICSSLSPPSPSLGFSFFSFTIRYNTLASS
jgi:hypothetical protein